MTDIELTRLSKKELIQIVENLRNRYSVSKDDMLLSAINYRALLDGSSDIIFYLDKEGNIRYINPAWQEYYPSFANKKLGGHYSKNIPSIEQKRATVVFDEVIKKGTVITNEMMKTKSEKGEAIYFTASFAPIRSDDGDIIGLVGNMRDITDQHIMSKRLKANTKVLEEKIKEEVRQSEELRNLQDLNEDIISNAPFGILMMEPSGTVLMENPSLKAIMGRGPDDSLVGVNLLDYKGFTDSGFGRLFYQCLEKKKRVKESNIPYTSFSGGDDLILNVTADPIFDKNSSVEKMLIMVEDYTEQAQIAVKAKKTEQISALGLLASGVASGLRNHVNSMVMDLNFVDNNLEDGSPASEYVDSLQSELSSIKKISGQLLSLSSADSEEEEIFEINKIVSVHPVEVLLNRLKNEGFGVDITLCDKNPLIKASSHQIQQLFIQFIENAEEAMPEKGTLSITINEILTDSGDFVTLTISDTGIGIPPENLKRIFQPFFTTKGQKGTGLGLMIAASIIESLGGNIGIKSSPGEGTSVKVIFPIVEK